MIDTGRAREILATYRPGTPDESDPFYAEALELCGQDPALASWFQQQTEMDEELRSKLGEIQVPLDLPDRLVSPLEEDRPERVWRGPVLLLAAAAAIALVFIARDLWFDPADSVRLHTYRTQMVAVLSHDYEPEVESDSLEELRRTFASLQWPADYRVPAGIRAVPVEGGTAHTWRDRKISLLCLETKNDVYVWLFVTDASLLADAPDPDTAPRIVEEGGFRTAAWSHANRTYLLVAEGSEAFVRSLLPEQG